MCREVLDTAASCRGSTENSSLLYRRTNLRKFSSQQLSTLLGGAVGGRAKALAGIGCGGDGPGELLLVDCLLLPAAAAVLDAALQTGPLAGGTYIHTTRLGLAWLGQRDDNPITSIVCIHVFHTLIYLCCLLFIALCVL